MAEIASISGAASAWFTPTADTFSVFVQEGTVYVQVRFGAAQTFQTYVVELRGDNRSLGPMAIQAGSCAPITRDLPGAEFRLVSAGGSGAKAVAWE